MTDDRESFRIARIAGKAAAHEKRLENATYTAAEVKVLTEAALRLGRKEAGEEIAEAINVARIQRRWNAVAMAAAGECAQIARVIGSQPSPDTTSERTDPGVDSDLPPDSQATAEPIDDLVGALRKAVEAAKARRGKGGPS